MRIVIEFPFNTHWKVKKRFMNDTGSVYMFDNYKKDVLFETDSLDEFMTVFFSLSDYKFPYVDFWLIEEASFRDNFAIKNKIDFFVKPRLYNPWYGSTGA